MIPHLEQQIEFLTACRDHGEGRVEWRNRRVDVLSGKAGSWTLWSKASDSLPQFWKTCDYEFRIRPRTHVIPKAAVPMPLMVKPERGVPYFALVLALDEAIRKYTWSGDGFDRRLFERGLCFATREDAEANMRAMLAREEE